MKVNDMDLETQGDNRYLLQIFCDALYSTIFESLEEIGGNIIGQVSQRILDIMLPVDHQSVGHHLMLSRTRNYTVNAEERMLVL